MVKQGGLEGSIVGYADSWYTVEYEDGDTEDLDEDEVANIVVEDSSVDNDDEGKGGARCKKRRVIEDSEDEEDAFQPNDDEEEEDEEEFLEDEEMASSDESVAEGPPPSKKTTGDGSDEGEDGDDAADDDAPDDDDDFIVDDTPKKKSAGWGFLSMSGYKPKKKATPRKNSSGTTAKSTASATASTGVRSANKGVYTAGDDLPVISHPQAMFDDMIFQQLTDGGRDASVLRPLLDKMRGRPLRIATMCSGTESPVLALDMLSKSIDDFYFHHMKGEEGKGKGKGDGVAKDGKDDDGHLLRIEHVFSCEIEPFKQAYIERNFQPPLLFRDIRELGNKRACTAYGSLADVPSKPGCVDMLIAGTSCVDYSNLNNEKKTIDQSGESGQTFRGMMDWIKKSQTPLVVLENVMGAPWPRKVEMFEEIGYRAEFAFVDTKKYYIPHTRSRGYLFAVRKDSWAGKAKMKKTIAQDWKDMVKSLERPASAALDAFMLPNDDPRVLRGRARLSSSRGGEGAERAGRVDWTKCETRHLLARSEEDLGDKRPLTGWSDAGNTAMPSFAWNEWVNAQVHRIHDLMDINTLRLAKEGIDCTYKTMVWNLSQNVDRDTMGKLGLCQCLTPSGVPYVTNRGGPLVGEELLLLQGIPADDLLLTRETEDNLKDLAGNAMSSTVVGACMLSALILGHDALFDRSKDDGAAKVGEIVHNLVPRPLNPASDEIEITQDMGTYETKDLPLGPKSSPPFASLDRLLGEAHSSARKCLSEGPDKTLPVKDLLVCRSCGHTSSVECSTPARKYEEHDFIPYSQLKGDRIIPDAFQGKLLDLIPMQIILEGFNANEKDRAKNGIENALWDGWTEALTRATTVSSNEGSGKDEPAVFRFTCLDRSHIWTVTYESVNKSRLELRISDRKAQWFLFAKPPVARSKLREVLDRPLARMRVKGEGVGKKSNLSLLSGAWELCLPVETPIDVTVKGLGDPIESWACKLGLKEEFEKQRRYAKLEINVDAPGNEQWGKRINGEYDLLPKCGTACGSLHKRTSKTDDSEDMFFFLESGRRSTPEEDSFIFSTSKHRTKYGEYRETVLYVDPKAKYRPSAPELGKDAKDAKEKNIKAYIPGLWLCMPGARAVSESSLLNKKFFSSELTTPAASSMLSVPVSKDGWKKCPEILRCTVPVQRNDRLYRDCITASCHALSQRNSKWLDVNLRKSKSIFDALAFVISRASELPDVVTHSWLELHNSPGIQEDGRDVSCIKCAPVKPGVKWMRVTQGKRQLFVPKEDVKEAANYEQTLKNRPNPWLVRLRILGDGKQSKSCLERLELSIGCNAVSLTQRSMGLLPPHSLVRKAMVQLSSNSETTQSSRCVFEWRVLKHEDKSMSSGVDSFPKMYLTSNKKDKCAAQPPNFKKYPLRHEQLRSLKWMLDQEATTNPFWEEEVSEAILPGLKWRAEGKARRPVLVRGGIVADEVGYGKTAITLGLIDASPAENGPPPKPPAEFRQSHIHTKATLVVVPSHLMGQWPKEVKKFLGGNPSVCVIKDMNSFNNLTVSQIKDADIVIVNFTVLSCDRYFSRLARLAGVNASGVPAGGKTGGRHFDSVYNDCLSNLAPRVQSLVEDCSAVFQSIEEDAERNSSEEQNTSTSVRLDGKKAVYKNVSEETTKKEMAHFEPKEKGAKGKKRKSAGNKKTLKTDHDPWGLHGCEDVEKMKCPPLEVFFWNRVVVDEFHYLADKADRARVLTLVLGLNSSFRWCLSGTPPHKSFNDAQILAKLLGIHLGVEDTLPGEKVNKRGGKKADAETTKLEQFSSLLEIRSMQWHERRHKLGQEFLNRFVRQNIAEIDEIKCEEHVKVVTLPPAERGVYLELATALQSLDMNSKRALKSKKSARGDREIRMQEILEGSADAEEALLKRCTHFDLSSESSTALEACDRIIDLREKQKNDCKRELTNNVASALRQRLRILEHHPQWEGTKKTEKGEVQDRLAQYVEDVQKHQSISGGADEEVHTEIEKIMKAAKEEVKRTPHKYDDRYADVNGDTGDNEEGCTKKRKRTGKKKNSEVSQETLYAMKFALREHMHEIRALGKELCGRTRSLRYFKWVRDFQLSNIEIQCSRCNSAIPRGSTGVLSSCGHVGCLKCLHSCADNEVCIDKTCQAPVKSSNVVSADDLGVDKNHTKGGGNYGAKLTDVVTNVKKIVRDDDRAIIFVQFKDLKEKVAEALDNNGVKALQVKGPVSSQIKALDVLQKEKPDKKDPRVLLLTMDDESSAGVNLTTCNHAIFVHPLLADTQQQYEAYETQAIGRIRRYGQMKVVNVWRYFARDTIDTDIFKERTGRVVN